MLQTRNVTVPEFDRVLKHVLNEKNRKANRSITLALCPWCLSVSGTGQCLCTHKQEVGLCSRKSTSCLLFFSRYLHFLCTRQHSDGRPRSASTSYVIVQPQSLRTATSPFPTARTKQFFSFFKVSLSLKRKVLIIIQRKTCFFFKLPPL